MINNSGDLSKILQRIKDGDVEAFKSIFNSHFNLLYLYVFKISKNHSLSQDISQEAFISLWTNRKNLDIDLSIESFLYKTAYNKFVDQYRKDQRGQVFKQEFYFRKTLELVQEDDSKKTEKLKLLRKEIARLPPKCKEIFELAKVDGLKYKEIAIKLKVSIKTVENQMGIALMKLREALIKSRGKV